VNTFRSVNPARPDDVVGEYPTHGPADVDAAVGRAAAAQRDWARVPAPARAEVIAGAAAVIARDKEAMTALVSREAGKVLVEAGGDVQEAVDMAHFVAGQGRSAWGEMVPSELGDKLCWTTRQPVGVVGMITPWNFPVAIPSWKIFPAVLAGNGVVIKPSEHAPACCEAFVAACIEAGVPSDLLQVVHGFAEPAAALASHPGVRAVSFTGSVATGRKVAEAAGRQLKRVLLELGGYNPLIVLADADLEYAVSAAAFGAYLHQGQICMSARRLIVEQPIAEAFVGRLADKTAGLKAGDPGEHDTVIGPLINEAALETVAGRVRDAVAGGARVLAGGERTGRCFQATLLADVPPDSELARLETFGPVASVEVVGNADEAVRHANDTPYGLAAGILTSDPDRGLALAERIQSGIVHVNDQPVHDEPQMPFGGVKDSGWGRFGGAAATAEFTELKWVTVQSGTRPFPF
jgi:acyl-CoA reductase-like NAD-dependent aldehyde dehydrogenase